MRTRPASWRRARWRSIPSNRGAWHLWALTEPVPRERMQRWRQIVERFPEDDLARASLADNATSLASAERDREALQIAIRSYEHAAAEDDGSGAARGPRARARRRCAAGRSSALIGGLRPRVADAQGELPREVEQVGEVERFAE